MSGEINTGHDMWEDHKNQYGVITARIMCLRYLDMQAHKTDPEERQFCRELREAMTMERNLADKPMYRKSWEDAQRDGETELFNDSDMTNKWCSGEIDDAIRACEYGDGSHKLEPAIHAMLEHCGEERLSFLLAVEVRRHRDEFSAENRAWSDGFDIQNGFAGSNIRARTDVLDEFITCLRETIDRTREAERHIYTDGAEFWRDLVQTSVSFDAALETGGKHIEALGRRECSESELRVCDELRAAMNGAIAAGLDKTAAFIVETSARETTSGNYITGAGDIPADIISPELFSKNIDAIVEKLRDYGAVLDAEVSDSAIDIVMGLAYCPNYEAMPGEEDDYPEDREIFDPLLTKGENQPGVAEAPELNESEQNFKAWMAVTESSRYKWVEDEIVRLNGRGAMYYTGGEDGVYMRIHNDGRLEAGKYEGAIPHIGEAMFQPVVNKQFDSFSKAYTAAMEAGGKQFLVDMFSGSEPQPLFPTKRGAQEEKPSVMKQIRDAQKTPQPPHRDKSPEQRKKKGDIDL